MDRLSIDYESVPTPLTDKLPDLIQSVHKAIKDRVLIGQEQTGNNTSTVQLEKGLKISLQYDPDKDRSIISVQSESHPIGELETIGDYNIRLGLAVISLLWTNNLELRISKAETYLKYSIQQSANNIHKGIELAKLLEEHEKRRVITAQLMALLRNKIYDNI